MAHANFSDLLLIIQYGNAAVVRQRWHDQPRDFSQGNLMVKRKGQDITGLVKYLLLFLRVFAMANVAEVRNICPDSRFMKVISDSTLDPAHRTIFMKIGMLDGNCEARSCGDYSKLFPYLARII